MCELNFFLQSEEVSKPGANVGALGFQLSVRGG